MSGVDPATTAPADRQRCETCSGTGYVESDEARGAEMRARRLASTLSLNAVALRAGISQGYLSDLERGRRHWNARLVAAVADAIEEGPPLDQPGRAG